LRILILGLDGLEYDLVVSGKLRSLLQNTFGKIEIGPEYCTMVDGEPTPYTPIVWSSFITGLPPRLHRVRDLWTYGQTLDTIKRFPLFSKIRGKRRLLWKVGLKPRTPNIKDLKAKTLFDLIQPSIAIDIIGYNPWGYMANLASSKTIDEYIKNAERLFKKKKKTILKEIEADWKLFMAYIHFTDAAGHCYSFRRLKTVYQALDNFLFKIKEILGDNTLCLVISDHGMEKKKKGNGRLHTHSTHAFYSFNFKTDWRPKKITDFFPKILEWAELACP
jgi:hypothetical protein